MRLDQSDRDSAIPTPLQLHFQQCTLATGAGHRLHCAAEALKAFVAPRIVSVLVGIALLVTMALFLLLGTT